VSELKYGPLSRGTNVVPFILQRRFTGAISLISQESRQISDLFSSKMADLELLRMTMDDYIMASDKTNPFMINEGDWCTDANGTADCRQDRYSELWYGNHAKTFAKYTGGRTLAMDLYMVQTIAQLVPRLVDRQRRPGDQYMVNKTASVLIGDSSNVNSIVSGGWIGTESDITLYYPSVPLQGLADGVDYGNENLGDWIENGADSNEYNKTYMSVSRRENNPLKKVVWSNPYVDPSIEGKIFISAVAPYYANNKILDYQFVDEYIGTIGLDIDLLAVSNLLEAVRLTPRSFSFILNYDGETIVSTLPITKLIFGRSATYEGIVGMSVNKIPQMTTRWDEITSTILQSSTRSGMLETRIEFPSQGIVEMSNLVGKGEGTIEEAYLVFSKFSENVNTWITLSAVPKKELDEATDVHIDRGIFSKKYEMTYGDIKDSSIVLTHKGILIDLEVSLIRYTRIFPFSPPISPITIDISLTKECIFLYCTTIIYTWHRLDELTLNTVESIEVSGKTISDPLLIPGPHRLAPRGNMTIHMKTDTSGVSLGINENVLYIAIASSHYKSCNHQSLNALKLTVNVVGTSQNTLAITGGSISGSLFFALAFIFAIRRLGPKVSRMLGAVALELIKEGVLIGLETGDLVGDIYSYLYFVESASLFPVALNACYSIVIALIVVITIIKFYVKGRYFMELWRAGKNVARSSNAKPPAVYWGVHKVLRNPFKKHTSTLEEYNPSLEELKEATDKFERLCIFLENLPVLAINISIFVLALARGQEADGESMSQAGIIAVFISSLFNAFMVGIKVGKMLARKKMNQPDKKKPGIAQQIITDQLNKVLNGGDEKRKTLTSSVKNDARISPSPVNGPKD
jgi:hypothetical protein